VVRVSFERHYIKRITRHLAFRSDRSTPQVLYRQVPLFYKIHPVTSNCIPFWILLYNCQIKMQFADFILFFIFILQFLVDKQMPAIKCRTCVSAIRHFEFFFYRKTGRLCKLELLYSVLRHMSMSTCSGRHTQPGFFFFLGHCLGIYITYYNPYNFYEEYDRQVINHGLYFSGNSLSFLAGCRFVLGLRQ